jgi:uncharacterized membrane protein
MMALVSGLVFIIAGLPFYFEKVRPNRWAGFRVAKTLSNPQIWYAANKVMGLDFIRAGIVLLVISIPVLMLRRTLLSPSLTGSIETLVISGSLLAIVIHCFWRLIRM